MRLEPWSVTKSLQLDPANIVFVPGKETIPPDLLSFEQPVIVNIFLYLIRKQDITRLSGTRSMVCYQVRRFKHKEGNKRPMGP